MVVEGKTGWNGGSGDNQGRGSGKGGLWQGNSMGMPKCACFGIPFCELGMSESDMLEIRMTATSPAFGSRLWHFRHLDRSGKNWLLPLDSNRCLDSLV